MVGREARMMPIFQKMPMAHVPKRHPKAARDLLTQHLMCVWQCLHGLWRISREMWLVPRKLPNQKITQALFLPCDEDQPPVYQFYLLPRWDAVRALKIF